MEKGFERVLDIVRCFARERTKLKSGRSGNKDSLDVLLEFTCNGMAEETLKSAVPTSSGEGDAEIAYTSAFSAAVNNCGERHRIHGLLHTKGHTSFCECLGNWKGFKHLGGRRIRVQTGEVPRQQQRQKHRL
ncbi:hypothetical protein Sjap_013590 [Stephania japonica]|uniref:Uncharacterized protein n=1 Tax=Stephania japonica TaxID=461633 RepID=A0AAP0IYC9_9MAGN